MQHAQKSLQWSTHRSTKMTSPAPETSSIFRSPARSLTSPTPETSRLKSPLIDIITPPQTDTVVTKIGEVKIDNPPPPTPEQPKKDATDDLIVSILSNTHTHTHTQTHPADIIKTFLITENAQCHDDPYKR